MVPQRAGVGNCEGGGHGLSRCPLAVRLPEDVCHLLQPPPKASSELRREQRINGFADDALLPLLVRLCGHDQETSALAKIRAHEWLRLAVPEDPALHFVLVLKQIG